MCMYCRSALHMVGVGNQASSPSSKNTLRTICTSTKVEFFLLVPGHPGTTPSYAPEYVWFIVSGVWDGHDLTELSLSCSARMVYMPVFSHRFRNCIP